MQQLKFCLCNCFEAFLFCWLALADDDEESDSSHVTDCKDRRRAAHTVAEQKRRDAIKVS